MFSERQISAIEHQQAASTHREALVATAERLDGAIARTENLPSGLKSIVRLLDIRGQKKLTRELMQNAQAFETESNRVRSELYLAPGTYDFVHLRETLSDYTRYGGGQGALHLSLSAKINGDEYIVKYVAPEFKVERTDETDTTVTIHEGIRSLKPVINIPWRRQQLLVGVYAGRSDHIQYYKRPDLYNCRELSIYWASALHPADHREQRSLLQRI